MTTVSPGVTVVAKSESGKTGAVSATYVAQESCPGSCPLRNAGCYAELGNVLYQSRRLNAQAQLANESVESLAIAEAAGIDALTANLPLRVHVVGDCATDSAAQHVSAAMVRYGERGQPAWTYTHAWKDVSRKSWGNASVLASCETISQTREARDRGYAVAVIVAEHPSDHAYQIDGHTVIPCPEQTRGIKCSDCKLCMRSSDLYARDVGIAFAAHGPRKKKIVAMLEQK